MTLYTYKNIAPKIEDGCFVADSADVIGKVFMGKNSNLWFQVVARGDVNEIHIGENTNIQDLSMLHVIDELPLIIGKNVSVGHKVTLHACTIGDGCLIGMGATVLDGAEIGENSLVAAGSVVPPGKKYPAGSFIIGAPAIVRRPLTSEEIDRYSNHYKSYLITKEEYQKEVKCLNG
ncbi:gamma carbonic anhydrase family protein [Bacteriovorax sp. Seq25_V]|uniref:gamma carbonic anhydrase family protein n=1 Tax=Bacteriovorax sp. Seq25_V TaxID=1201288 RepID=UPI00038A2738|nr:gamma carbonic anhydrase family protein [Bacteriovorax sp. Seq25_V]EQC45517.1 transferase hexapeptide repeat protein [Bacteriovorax sp. Seq25_V]